MRCGVPIAIVLACAATAGGGEVDFGRDILPILSNNCFACHGPDEGTRKAGLRLDQEDAAHAALLPTPSAPSLVLERITSDAPGDIMPPPDTGKSLTESEIDALRAWVESGAPYETHWSFIKPERPAVPHTADAAWPKNPIDAFILARLEAEGIAPSPVADAATLLRRVHLDLTGLPPTPEEAAQFTQNPSPEAYEAVVDGLLASPHFGERWGRHWLDAARYADSHGYSIDGERSIWPYRDWVIEAFNRNLPFDQFVIEQLAGDQLPDAAQDQRVATGFHRNTMINQEGGIDKEEFRLEALYDRVDTTGTVFLGLTMGCARCHTHKYDPILIEEYYQLLAFYNNDNEPDLELGTAEQQAERARIRKEIAAVQAELDAYLEAAESNEQVAWEKGLTLGFLEQFPIPTREAFIIPPYQRDTEQRRLVRDIFLREDETAKEFTARMSELHRSMPPVPTTMVLEARADPRDTHVFLQGDFTRKGDRVTPGVPAILHDLPPDHRGTRLDLAQWIVDPGNPLTARVTMNRFWQRLFGLGLVETENDFGIQGLPPSHPALLDWLATEFMGSGWDMKHMLRLMVTSATYRQASYARPEIATRDPRNRLLARQNRIRLDAEIIRDAALKVSGRFNPEIGGPSVHPPQPDGVMGLGQRKRDWPTSEGPDRYRRGIYTFFWRGNPYPALTVFDAPIAQTACTRRVRSNTPLQALTLLNDTAFVELAEGLAERLCAGESASDDERIRQAFPIALGREAEPDEVAVLTQLLASERAALAGLPGAEEAAWTTVARALLNTDEFITRE